MLDKIDHFIDAMMTVDMGLPPKILEQFDDEVDKLADSKKPNKEKVIDFLRLCIQYIELHG